MLKISTNNWRSRWLVLPEWDVLHRVAEIEWGTEPPGEEGEGPTDPDLLEDFKKEMIQGNGKTVCGKEGFMIMPGIFSRMGLPRCEECCKLIGIAVGKGCPENNPNYNKDEEKFNVQ